MAKVAAVVISCTAVKVGQRRNLVGEVNLSLDRRIGRNRTKAVCRQLLHISCFSNLASRSSSQSHTSPQPHGVKEGLLPASEPSHNPHPTKCVLLKVSECYLLCPTGTEMSLHLKIKVNISTFHSFAPSPSKLASLAFFCFLTESMLRTSVCLCREPPVGFFLLSSSCSPPFCLLSLI